MKTGFLAGILVLGVTAGLAACGSDSTTDAVAPSALVERRGACPQNYELIDVEEAGDSAAGVDEKRGRLRLPAGVPLREGEVHRYAVPSHGLRGRSLAMEDRDSGWEQGRCPNSACSGGTMWIKRSQRQDELWLVTRSLDQRPCVEAAVGPFCPLCSEDLIPLAEAAADERRGAA